MDTLEEFPNPNNFNQSNIDGDMKNLNDRDGFVKKVDANTTSYLLTGLKHYTYYQISVRACRSNENGDQDEKVKNCSNEVIIHQRTRKIGIGFHS